MALEDWMIGQARKAQKELCDKGEAVGSHLAFWGKQIQDTFELAGRVGADPIDPKTLARISDVIKDLKAEMDQLQNKINAMRVHLGEGS